MVEQMKILGHYLPQCQFIPSDKQQELGFFSGDGRRLRFTIDEPSLFRNTMFMGASGTGKTTIINQVFYQLRSPAYSEAYFTMVFDTKADYIAHKGFFRPGDYIIGNSRMFRDRSVTWNIFEEILADGEEPADYEANAKEIAQILFDGRGSKTQPFFANAARDIFAWTMIYFLRRVRDGNSEWKDRLNNRDLLRFLHNYGAAELRQYFSRYPDMRFLLSYFGDGSSNQALGVFAELHSMLSDCFQGIFGEKPKAGASFSIRKAVRSKGNRALFLEYDMAVGSSLTPMYRLLVDLALKEALSTSASPGRTYLVLDELKLLPRLTHLQDALNYGRSHRVAVFGGIQTVDQLYVNYGEYQAREILEGFGNLIALKTTDHASREYISRRFGPNVIGYRYYNVSKEPIDREREGFVVEHWTQQQLPQGKAIVGLASQAEPFLFQFEDDPYA